jgi:putative endonuclease
LGASGLRLGAPAMKIKYFYVYVLTSVLDSRRHYTGFTEDLSARLKDHNAGSCPHTAKYRPWQIETAVAFASRKKALAFERYLKTGSGREFARRHF